MKEGDFQWHMERAEFYAEEAEKALRDLNAWVADWKRRREKKARPQARDDDDIYDERNW